MGSLVFAAFSVVTFFPFVAQGANALNKMIFIFVLIELIYVQPGWRAVVLISVLFDFFFSLFIYCDTIS